jgi:hypothetical protein
LLSGFYNHKIDFVCALPHLLQYRFHRIFLNKQPADLIVMDVAMPKMNAGEAASVINHFSSPTPSGSALRRGTKLSCPPTAGRLLCVSVSPVGQKHVWQSILPTSRNVPLNVWNSPLQMLPSSLRRVNERQPKRRVMGHKVMLKENVIVKAQAEFVFGSPNRSLLGYERSLRSYPINPCGFSGRGF